MSDEKIKISQLPESTSLRGLHTIGTDSRGASVKVSLQFVEDEVTRAVGNAATATQNAKTATAAANTAVASANEVRRAYDNGELKGEKGDPFTYSDFTPSQLNALKVKGDTGATGPVGPKGDKGEKGDAFRYSDFTPSQLEGLKVKGDTGNTGATGPQGPQGEQGIRGPQGAVGPAGPTGPKGDKGDAFTFDDLTEEQIAQLGAAINTLEPLTEAEINTICV